MRKLWLLFKNVPTWAIVFLFALSAITAVVALRHNNEQMVRLRDAVYAADKAGTDVNQPLNRLRSYVYGHMNTNLASSGNSIKPPIQLKYTYQRLQAAAQAKVDSANSALYTDAENYCLIQSPTRLSPQVPCVQSYVLSHGGAKAAQIPAALYQFDFASPSWSPDPAGWSLLATALLAVLAGINYLAKRFSH